MNEIDLGVGSLMLPTIVAISDQEIVVFDLQGYLLHVFLDDSPRINRLPAFHTVGNTPIGTSFCSPVSLDGTSWTCAVGTQCPWFILWGAVEGNVVRQDTTDSVHSLAYLQNEQLLAVGCGAFYLRPDHRGSAHLEFWTTTLNPECVDTVAVPGSGVTGIAMTEDEDLLCVSGHHSQKYGFLTTLGLRTLKAKSIVEAPVMFSRVLSIYHDAVLCVSQNLLQLVSYETGKVKWHTGADAAAMCPHDYRVLLTSDGRLLNKFDGRTTSQVDPLPECVAMASLPNDGVVGVSKTGKLKVWKFSE